MDDSGFESEIFYSDSETEDIIPFSYEPLSYHNNNNVTIAFQNHENNQPSLQEINVIPTASQDLDDLLHVMENMMTDAVDVDAVARDVRDLETPEDPGANPCTIEGCFCREDHWEQYQQDEPRSSGSDEFSSICNELTKACGNQEKPHKETSTEEKETQTEVQEGDDERTYDGENVLMTFSNEQVTRMMEKHDKLQAEALVRENEEKKKNEELMNKNDQLWEENIRMADECRRIENYYAEIDDDQKRRIHELEMELRATKNIVEKNIVREQTRTVEIQKLHLKLQQCRDENIRARSALDKEKKISQKRFNELYNKENIFASHNGEASTSNTMATFSFGKPSGAAGGSTFGDNNQKYGSDGFPARPMFGARNSFGFGQPRGFGASSEDGFGASTSQGQAFRPNFGHIKDDKSETEKMWNRDKKESKPVKSEWKNKTKRMM